MSATRLPLKDGTGTENELRPRCEEVGLRPCRDPENIATIGKGIARADEHVVEPLLEDVPGRETVDVIRLLVGIGDGMGRILALEDQFEGLRSVRCGAGEDQCQQKAGEETCDVHFKLLSSPAVDGWSMDSEY